MHWRAALTTAARAQPPPIHPSSIEPSGPIKALAPAFAAVTEIVRTTVASANVWPFGLTQSGLLEHAHYILAR